ncbi:MAG: hypothetical protein ACK5O2_10370 [Microthrixaceae bacterium]
MGDVADGRCRRWEVSQTGGVADDGVVPPRVEEGGLGTSDASRSDHETVPVALWGLGYLGVT